MAEKRYIAAGGVVIHNGRVLVLDRPTRGEVRLPKGHVERGEHVAETAVREVAEEAGYDDLEVLADLGSQVIEFDFDGNHVIRTEHYFLMRLHSDREVQRGKKDAAQFAPLWLSPEEALDQLTFLAEQESVRRALVAYAGLSSPDA